MAEAQPSRNKRSTTTQAAYYLYRERFLIARFGLSILGEELDDIEWYEGVV
jgi:hypothetical protein